MPIYVYKCNHCEVVLEKVRPASKMKETFACTECGDGTMEHAIATPGRFQRGSGWAARMDGASMPGEM